MKNTALSFITLFVLSSFSNAGGDIVPMDEFLEETVESTWEFRLSPYVWFAGLKGDVANIPNLPAMPIDVSPSDALEDTEASAMFMFEAKKNEKGLFVDVFYSDVRSEELLIDANAGSFVLKSITKTTMASGSYLYEVYNEEQSVIDLFAGVRYWKIDSYLFLGGTGGILPPGDHVESWVDPLIGIKGRTTLGNTKFYVTAGAATGGFGIGSDHFYDLSGYLGYQWNESIGTAVGYRMYDLDYEDDGFVYDVRQQGWMFGLTWAF